MDLNSFNFVGKSSTTGQLTVIRPTDFNRQLQSNKGKTFVGNIQFLHESATHPHRTYYFKHVLPKFASGLLKLGYIEKLEFAEETAREISPVCWEENYTDSGIYTSRLKRIDELTDKELAFHISIIKMKAASWLQLYINDKFEL